MKRCNEPGCEGHTGEYADCVSAAVAWHAGEWADDTTGDLAAPCGHVAIVELERRALPVAPWDRMVIVPAGTYLVTHKDSHVRADVAHYVDRDIAEQEFARAVKAHTAWADAHDPECVSCEHDCPWKRTPAPMGAPFCATCDDHWEAGEDDRDDNRESATRALRALRIDPSTD